MFLTMLDPAAALQVWNESLPHTQDGRPRLAAISVVDAAMGKRWAVQYRPKGTAPGTAGNPLLVAQRFPDGELIAALKRIQRLGNRLQCRQPNLADWIGSRPEDELLLFPFPLDTRIPSLVSATNPETARQLLRACPQIAPSVGETAEGCTVEALRYVPGKRCQIRYTFRWNGKTRRLLGKVFRDNRGEGLFHVMNSVATHFQRNGDPDLIAGRPLAYQPEWRILLQTHLPGSTLYELLRQGLAEDAHLMGAARSIALLHAGHIALENQHLPWDEVSLISRSVANLQAAGLAAPRFHPVLERIIDLADNSLSPSSVAPVHRDFYDKQLLIHGRRTALIDLDTLAIGLPEIDIANFLAHLHLRSLQRVSGLRRAAAWAQLFVQEYRRHSVFTLDAGRVRFFMAAAFLRLACKYRAGKNSPFLAESLLLSAEQTLDAAPNRGLLQCLR